MSAQHTPGPWGWFGNEFSFYLATQHGGRRYVMDFVRMGMNRAQPRFRVNGVMEKAAELAVFEVGDRGVVGMYAAQSAPSVYRTDIIGFDHPDARLIAAAPELLAALMAALGSEGADGRWREQAHAAIAKAAANAWIDDGEAR